MRVKDLWFDKGRRKTTRHPDNGGNKQAKRWLAIWIGPDGREKSRAFAIQDTAKKYAAKMEADAQLLVGGETGSYVSAVAAGRPLNYPRHQTGACGGGLGAGHPIPLPCGASPLTGSPADDLTAHRENGEWPRTTHLAWSRVTQGRSRRA